MKLLVIITIIIFGNQGLYAQTTGDARQDIYHEKYNSALEKLETIVGTNPNDVDAWYWLTQVYLQKDSVDKAKANLISAPAEVLSSPLLKVAYGHIMLREGNQAAARENFDYAIKKTKSKSPPVLHAVARAQMDAKSGDAAYGIELVNKALKRNKNNPALYVTMGDLYRKLGNGSESYRAYQNALGKDENYVAALYKIGKIFTSQKNTEMYLKYFNKAASIDPLYAPALYELYYHYYFRDVNMAQQYLDKYIAASDKSIQNEYMATDLLFASGKYPEALQKASALIKSNENATEPRLLKLVAYSYKEMNQTDSALAYMQQYFNSRPDSGYIVKDFETMGDIYDSLPGMEDSASTYYQRALAMETDSVKALDYYKKIANMYSESKDYANEALWLGKYYAGSSSPRNIDLFNWGIASYKAEDYALADSVFRIYQTQYPEQTFGYYWSARSNAAIDSTMENGLAVPHYEKLITVAQSDTASETNRKHLIEAYGYLAAYEANIDKDANDSIEYFEKLLELDPGNDDARKYVEILRKSVAKQEEPKDGK